MEQLFKEETARRAVNAYFETQAMAYAMEPDPVKKQQIYNAAISGGLQIVAEHSAELYRLSVKRQFATARQNAEAKIQGRSPFEPKPLTLRNIPEQSETVSKPAQSPVTTEGASIAAQSAQTGKSAQPP